ncbi:MAG: RNA-binding protein [Clostridiales bacterium]|nr:RNA-binding protein [Clostridiales bacterium]
MDKFSSGSIVKSIAGRDSEELYIVKYIENAYAYLINGKSKPIENPKKKNIKHLFLLCKSEYSGVDVENLTDALVIKYLKDYKSKDYK